jgi:hypothetical protein
MPSVIQLDKAIYAATGIMPVFKDTGEEITFTLGVNQPIEIGFIKAKHVGIPLDSIIYSCRVKMLEVLASYLKEPDPFDKWIQMQIQN